MSILALRRPDLQIRAKGVWLSTVTRWGDLTFSGSWPGGCNELTFTATTAYGTRVASLLRAARLDLCWSGGTVWSGSVQEPDWNGTEVRVTAQGAFREAVGYTPLDGSDVPSDNALTATNRAIAHGLGWTVGTGIPNTSLGATSPYANLAGLLDDHATNLAKSWYVGADRVVNMVAAATTPSYQIRAGAQDMGIAVDDFASQVVLIYHDSGTDSTKSVIYPAFGSDGVYEATWGHQEWMKDITDQGAMTALVASGIAQAVYEKTKQKPGFTNGLELGVGEIVDSGWRPIHPARVALEGWGKVARHHGVPDVALATPYTDFVIGSTSHAAGSQTVTVNPVGLAARDNESVLTEVLQALAKSGALLGNAA